MAGLIISALIALGVVILLFMVIRIVPRKHAKQTANTCMS